VAKAEGRAEDATASEKAAAIQSFVIVRGCNKVLAPAFYFSNNEFFFIGFHQSCFARGLANFSVCTTV
jgi:hypothetical protein